MLDTDGFDLDSLKRADCYHFSIPFEYIEKITATIFMRSLLLAWRLM